MASFLGAGASGAGLLVLARNVPVSLATTAAQAVFTAAQDCVPLFCVLRAGATAWSATGSFKVGTTGALTSLVATTVATSLPTTVNQINNCFPASGATSVPAIASGTVVYFSMVQVEPTATQSFVDLVGYVR
jgi:hypothetical protein